MRHITFSLPGFPGLSIKAMEMPDGTIRLEFDIAEGSKASIQGIFFNHAEGSNVVASGPDVTTGPEAGVSKAGPGTAMNGAKGAVGDFDVGLGIGNPGRGQGVVTETSITLSSADDTPLTLDILSHQLLGIRLQNAGPAGPKHVMVMPAAPDAISDTVDAVEDTQAVFDVTGNDTDADGNLLTIVDVQDPTHGTVQIVDNKLVYIADEHWSGTETFTYTVSDGTGGFDTATVTVNVDAVADAPELEVATSAGSNVNEIVVDISSALVDRDGSESYKLKISNVAPGVTVVGAVFENGAYYIHNPDGTDQIKLQLAPGADYGFDLKIEAISTEDGTAPGPTSNDTAVTGTTIDIVVDHNVSSGTVNFDAVDQSQWTTGDQFTFDDERFIGVDTSGSGGYGGFLSGSAEWDLRVGLNSDLRFEGGEVDATIPWDLSVDSTFNRTTDVLRLDTSAVIASGGTFATDGPELTYMLDLIFDVFLKASMDIVIDFGKLGTLDEEIFDETFIDLNETINIVNFDSNTSPSIGYDFPYGISATLTWPNLEVQGTQDSLGQYSGSGASNNALDINLDLDEMIVQILNKLGVPVPPMDVGFDWEVVYANLSLLDADIFAGLNFLQEFALDAGTLAAELVFENGSRQAFNFGDELVFSNASSLDADKDGEVEFYIDMDLVDSMFSNDTDLGFNAGWNFDLISGYAGYDTFIFGSDEKSFGPLLDLGQTYPIASVGVYDNKFELNFGEETFSFWA